MATFGDTLNLHSQLLYLGRRTRQKAATQKKAQKQSTLLAWQAKRKETVLVQLTITVECNQVENKYHLVHSVPYVYPFVTEQAGRSEYCMFPILLPSGNTGKHVSTPTIR